MATMEDTEGLEVVPKQERSLHRTVRITEVMDLLEVVPKPDHSRSVGTQDIMEVPEVARKLGHSPSTKVNHPSDPEEDTLKFISRAMGLAYESVLMNQLMERKRRPKARLGFGRAEKTNDEINTKDSC